MDVKWTASRAAAREVRGSSERWPSLKRKSETSRDALMSLLALQMKPFLKSKVKRRRRGQKCVTSGSPTERLKLCESSHCPRQTLFLQQEKLGPV